MKNKTNISWGLLLIFFGLFHFAHAAAPTTGLVGYYSFDSGAATDGSGNGNNGTISGATATTGNVNGALSFNGSSYVQVPHLTALESGDWTFSLWINPSDLIGVKMLLNQFSTSPASGPILYTSGPNIDWQIGGDDFLTTGSILTTNTWTHITVTAQGSQLHVYKNGVEISGSPKTITRTDGGTSNFFIGGPTKAGIAAFTGSIDEVRIYNRALSSSEVSAVYADGGGGGTTNPPPTPVNGACSTTVNMCTAGTFLDQTDSQTQNLWQCTGTNGGTTASCSTTITQNNPPPVGSDIYIAQTQSGTGDASSCANAKGVSYFNTASNWTPGKTFHLCGTISTPLQMGGSGTASNPITVYFEPNAKLSAPHWNQNNQNDNAALYGNGLSYITVDGGTNGTVEATANGTALQYQNISNGISFVGGSNGITVKNMHVNNLYVRTPESADATYVANGISLKGGYTNATITGNFTSNAGSGIYLAYRQGSSNLTVSNNTLRAHGIALVIGGESTGSTLDNVRVFNNDMAANTEWSGNPDIHTNLMHIHAVASGDNVTNVRVYNNYFHGNMGRYPTSLTFFEGYITAPLIYNNVYFHDQFVGGNGDITLKGANGAVVMNNTMDSNNFGTAIGTSDWTGTDTFSAYNNIILNHNYAIYDGTSGKNAVQAADYNLVYPSTTLFRYGGVSGHSYTEWRSAGFDAHGLGVNPQLDSSYRPSASSPSVNAGTSLSQYFSNDKDGVSRPQGSAWDMGAYEFNGVGGTNPPPIVGDFNNDGAVNSIDLSLMAGAWNTTNATYDLNGDGRVNTLDYVIMVRNWTN